MPPSDLKLLLGFIFLLLIASFTAYSASQKGRNPSVWFTIGILLGVVAPFILMLFPSLKNGDEKNLRVNVSNSPPSLESSQASLSEQPIPQNEEDKLWYYLDQDHQQIGPVSIIALRELWNRGKLELNQYVWSAGMGKWEKVENLKDLRAVLSKSHD